MDEHALRLRLWNKLHFLSKCSTAHCLFIVLKTFDKNLFRFMKWTQWNFLFLVVQKHVLPEESCKYRHNKTPLADWVERKRTEEEHTESPKWSQRQKVLFAKGTKVQKVLKYKRYYSTISTIVLLVLWVLCVWCVVIESTHTMHTHKRNHRKYLRTFNKNKVSYPISYKNYHFRG